MNIRLHSLTLLAAMGSLGTSLNAQTPAPAAADKPADEVVTLEKLDVSDIPIEKNIIPSSRPFNSVFGTDQNITEIPRNVTIISREQLSAISIKDVRDFSKLTSSSFTRTNFGAPANPDIRGSNADVFINGVRERATSNGNGLPLDFNSVESVNIVKGPATAVQGSSSYVGGFVDLITKRPFFDAAHGEAFATVGDYGAFRYGVDYGAPISDKLAYRFSYSGEDSESYYNDMHTHSQSLYGAITYKPTDKYELFVNSQIYYGDYTENWGWNRPTQLLIDKGLYQSGTISNAVIAANLSPSVFVNNNFGVLAGANTNGPLVSLGRDSKLSKPGDNSTGTNVKLQAIQTFKAAPDATVVNNNLITFTQRETLSSYYYSEVIAPTITLQSKWDWQKKYGSDSLFTAGLDGKYQSTKAYSYYGFEPANVWDLTKDHSGINSDSIVSTSGLAKVPGYNNRYYASDAFRGDSNESWGASVSPFLQNDYKISPELSLITGGRAEFLHVYTKAPDTKVDDSLNIILPSVNGSLVYKIKPKLSTYFTYNFSHNTAGAEGNGGGYLLTKTTGGGVPLAIDSDSYKTPAELYEIGSKASFLNDTLFVGAAVYHQTYFRRSPGSGGPADKYTNQGFEVEANYQPNKNFFGTVSYGYIDSLRSSGTDLLDFTTYKNISQGIPMHQFNALVSYTFDNGFGASLNGRVASEINNNFAGTLVIPVQYDLDASLFYTYKAWNFKLSATNLTDEKNFAPPNGLYGSQSILPEPGRQLAFTTTYKF